MVLIEPLIPLWFFSAIVLIIVSLSLLAYLVLTILKRGKKEKKILQKALEKKEEKKNKKTTYLDELLFVIGLAGFVFGYLMGNWWLLIIGTIIMFLSLYLLHHTLIPKHVEGKKVVPHLKEKGKRKKEIVKHISISGKKVVEKKIRATFKTELDTIYDIIIEKGSLKLKEVASMFNIPIRKAEEYAKILDEQGLLTFFFPVFGSPILRKKEYKRVGVIKKQKKKKIRLIIFAIVVIAILVTVYFVLRKYGYFY